MKALIKVNEAKRGVRILACEEMQYLPIPTGKKREFVYMYTRVNRYLLNKRSLSHIASSEIKRVVVKSKPVNE